MPLMGWNEYVLEGAGVSCSIIWESKVPAYTAFVIVIFFFCFLLPLLIMAFSYVNVYLTVSLRF
jgi:hypothetical protein